MKPLVQKLPLNADISFIAKTFATPHFEVPWHQHIEYEIILFTQGNGMAFIGNYVGEFAVGDVFLIGSQVPHTFQKQDMDMAASAVVVQFTDFFWGKYFLQIPECNELNNLFTLSMKGIKLESKHDDGLKKLIQDLEEATGFLRLSILCSCLQKIVADKHRFTLCTTQISLLNGKHLQRLDDVFKYTIAHFQQPITLPQIAAIAHMSITAFCAYFKKSTKKSYIAFLNEIRIGFACKLLQDTDKMVLDICYESGYNTAVNFNKQFLKIKKTTPKNFRKREGIVVSF